MRTSLAWLNLVHNKMRTGVAVAGVSFAVILIFMQLGFLGSVQRTATLIYDGLDFDIVIRSPGYLHISMPRTFPRSRLFTAESVSGVASVQPFYIGLNQWQSPLTGRIRGILFMGVKVGDPVFRSPEIQQKSLLLVDPQFALIDRKSRAEFGAANGREFSDEDIGMVTEVARKQVRITGHFLLGTGFAADGAILLSDQGFARIAPAQSLEEISLGLVKLQTGQDPAEVAARMRQVLPEDVEVLTRAQANAFELNRWVNQTSIGLIFKLGVLVALVVGTSIAYQVLSSDVRNHLGEYATLKAIGYRDADLSIIVLQQAVALAVLGFLTGLACSEVLYRITSRVANLPIQMNLPHFSLVLVLSLSMCSISGLGALRKVRGADPADLF